MRISDWSSDVCSSDLYARAGDGQAAAKGWKVERLARQPVDSAADEKILIEHRYGAIGGVRIADDLAQDGVDQRLSVRLRHVRRSRCGRCRFQRRAAREGLKEIVDTGRRWRQIGRAHV